MKDKNFSIVLKHKQTIAYLLDAGCNIDNNDVDSRNSACVIISSEKFHYYIPWSEIALVRIKKDKVTKNGYTR